MKKLIIIFVLLISCTENNDVQRHIEPIPTGIMSEKEKDMTEIIRTYRPYQTSLILYNQAKVKVHQMWESNTLSHSGFSHDAEQSGASCYAQAISFGYITAESNVQGFRTSPSHWNAIMNYDYQYIAVACEDRYTAVLVASWE